MDKHELYALIAQGEDAMTEFKGDMRQILDFAAEVIAFANTAGGRILLGVTDNGLIIGVEDVASTTTTIYATVQRECVPPPAVHVIPIPTDYGVVLVVEISHQPGVLHCLSNGLSYRRRGTSKHPLAVAG